jgi:hypothetical protein
MLQGRGMKVIVRENKNGITRTMSYGSLSTENKERALADLLVKSALGQALDQHQQTVSLSYIKRVNFWYNENCLQFIQCRHGQSFILRGFAMKK